MPVIIPVVAWTLVIALLCIAYVRLALSGDRRLSLLAAVGGIVGGVAFVLVALLFLGLRCDESCNDNLVPSVREPGWQHWSGSWEWYLQFALAVAALAATVLALAPRLRRFAAPAAVAITLGWAILMLA